MMKVKKRYGKEKKNANERLAWRNIDAEYSESMWWRERRRRRKKNACDLVFPSFSICFFLFTIVLYSSIVLRIHFKPWWHHQSIHSKKVYLVNLNRIAMLFKVFSNNVLVRLFTKQRKPVAFGVFFSSDDLISIILLNSLDNFMVGKRKNRGSWHKNR